MAKGNTPEPWERREDETSRAYEAFCTYRDIGPGRSIAKTGQLLGKNQTTLEQWSSKYGWVKRAAAWDDEQERIERTTAQKEQLKAIKDMRKRHADLGQAMLIKAARALAKLPDDEIKPQDISRMVDVASKLERISRGDVGEVVEERVGENATPSVTFYMPDNGRDRQEEEETP